MEAFQIRSASDQDFPRILELARRSLGWSDDDTLFLTWKHSQNPFGASPMWVAVTDARLVGFRAFLRWEFVTSDGALVRAVRAVDTATDPNYEGQGVFTRLTRAALEELRADGVGFVFNTPNGQSLPGYLKMGWQRLGRLPVAVRAARLRFLVTGLTARQGAARRPVSTTAGRAAREVLTDAAPIERLLRSISRPRGLSTRHSVASLQWRYGFEPLGYRAMLVGADPEEGLAIFRLRSRGRALEAVICDVLVPDDAVRVRRALLRRIAAVAAPDYLIRLGTNSVTADGLCRLPGIGPVLACRALAGSFPPAIPDWGLTMGDVELL
jgi:GNAT superfamily N-acetyltransferase